MSDVPKGIKILKNEDASTEEKEKWNIWVSPTLLPIIRDSDWEIDEEGSEMRVCGFIVRDGEFQAAAADTRCGRGT